jgi:2,3-diaminopropionate biosynthesis protein SbnA
MPILNNPLDLLFSNLFFELDGLSGSARLLLKLEGYNVTGSIKIKPALFMIDDLERRGLLEPHRSTIVESSSGNIGTALALICCRRGYEFICVTDPNISPFNRRSIEAYGGRVIIVDRKDTKGGYLENRIECIRSLLKENRDYVWLNQYANPYNLRAHEEWTALEILGEVPNVDYLYVGTGTTGTIMGLARRFAELSPATRVVAVEPEGSVTFDPGRGGRRLIPGIGTSRQPELADPELVHRIVYVPEIDAIRMCLWVARRHGLMIGGSSGSVLAAIAADAQQFAAGSTIVAISPDLGDKYLDTIFSPEWVDKHFGIGAATLDARAPAPAGEPLSEVIARHSPEFSSVLEPRRQTGSYERRSTGGNGSRAR